MTDRIQQETDALSDDLRWVLERADGYMDLKMLEKAETELASIPAATRKSLPYQNLRLRLAIEQQDWQASVRLATLLLETVPEEPTFWIQRAYVARRAENIDAARTILDRAYTRFPYIAVIPFNLACYACQTGDMDRARTYLRTAFGLDERFQELALTDPDLEPLWADIESGLDA